VPTYLVERYWSGVTSERLLEALNRSGRVIEQMSAEGTHVRDIITVLIPRGKRWCSRCMGDRRQTRSVRSTSVPISGLAASSKQSGCQAARAIS